MEMKGLFKELKKQEEKLFNCVHCGFCLPVCPTYTRLGDEADSPRGRLHFMRAVVEGRIGPESEALNRHLDRCLGCRACESVCPSGVEYSHLLEGAREMTAGASPPGLLSRLLPLVMANRSLRSPVMAATRLLRSTGFAELAAQRMSGNGLMGQMKLGLGMVAATARSSLQSREGRVPKEIGGDAYAGDRAGAGEDTSARRDASAGLGCGARVGILTGCVQEGLLGRVNQATVRVLEANGFELVDIGGQGCCGAIHSHTGDLEGARKLARRNIEAFEGQNLEFVAVNAAGCGAAMKEYAHLLAHDSAFNERAADLAAKVKDVSELLGKPGLLCGGPLKVSVTYDAPCHLLHAQRISEEPMALLDSIPGLVRIPLKGHDECCGGAGIYGITHPDLGGRISDDKVRAILETGAQVVATGNPGCMMQIGAGLKMAGSDVEVVHPIELLDESYRRGGFYR